MEIDKHWELIQRIFDESRRSSMHFAVATVSKDGTPHVAPIGALFLREDHTGFCFDEFTVNMGRNVDENQRVAILAVNSDPAFWQKSLVDGEFATAPGVRLMGSMGNRREATTEEIAMWQNHVRMAQGTKGYDILWKNMRTVRDIFFYSYEPVRCGEMTKNLWN